MVGVVLQSGAFYDSHWVFSGIELYLELDGKGQIDVAAFGQKQDHREALGKITSHLVFF